MRISYCSSDLCSSDRNFRNAGNRVDRPGTASRTPVRSGPAAAAAAWPALPARRAAPWEAHHARRSCKPPEDRDAAIAKVSPACHKAGLGSDHLTLAAVMAQLSYRSEEHTSELQSLMRISYAVFCLKKKNY